MGCRAAQYTIHPYGWGVGESGARARAPARDDSISGPVLFPVVVHDIYKEIKEKDIPPPP